MQKVVIVLFVLLVSASASAQTIDLQPLVSAIEANSVAADQMTQAVRALILALPKNINLDAEAGKPARDNGPQPMLEGPDGAAVRAKGTDSGAALAANPTTHQKLDALILATQELSKRIQELAKHFGAAQQ